MQKLSFKLLEDINKKYNIKHNPDSIFLHLAEEVGEVARELSKKQKNWRDEFDKEKLGEELSDAISQILIIAQDNDIDMDKAYQNKLIKIKQRFDIK